MCYIRVMEDSSFGINMRFARKSLHLTQKQLGELVGVEQVTIANYERGLRFPGEQILTSIARILRVSLDSLLGFTPLPLAEIEREDFQEIQNRVYTMMIEGEDLSLLNWLSRLMKENQISFIKIFTELIEPLLYRIGSDWQEGKLSIALEHYLSGKIRNFLPVLANIHPAESGRGKLWFGFCGPGEEHDMALYSMGQMLRLKGWSTWFFGVNLPLPDLVEMIETKAPDCISISLTSSKFLNGTNLYLKGIRELPRGKKTLLQVGGRGFSQWEAPPSLGLLRPDHLKNGLEQLEL